MMGRGPDATAINTHRIETERRHIEGTIRSAHLKRGNRVDANIYGILRGEWKPDRL